MLTARFSGHLSCMHIPFVMHVPLCHACSLCHACTPLSCMPPLLCMLPLPCMPPFAIHVPFPTHVDIRHTCPPVNRITDRCKNITFPQLRLRAVIIKVRWQIWLTLICLALTFMSHLCGKLRLPQTALPSFCCEALIFFEGKIFNGEGIM